MNWIDIHSHLYNATEETLEAYLDNALKKGVGTIVNSGTNPQTNIIVAAQSLKSDILFGTVGISPFDVLDLPDNWLTGIKGLLQHKKIIGVGEIGIDDSNPIYPPIEKQRPVFNALLEVGKELNLPVIIHSRGAEKEAIETCMATGITKALFHCFTGDISALKKLLDRGYYVSYSGIITFKKSGLDEIVRYTPVDRLFIETDTPYLTPHPLRGKQNEPANVVYVGKRIAELLQVSEEKLTETIQQNFTTLFSKKVKSE